MVIIFGRIFTRFKIVVILILLQMIVVWSLVGMLMTLYPRLRIVGTTISVLVFLALVESNKPSSYKLSWVIFVLTFLPVGGLLYLIFGNRRPTKRIAAYVGEHKLIAKHLDRKKIPDEMAAKFGRMASLFRYIRRASAYHPYQETKAVYYDFGEKMFDDILEELKKAQRFIFLEYFIIYKSTMWDQILEILLEKIQEGVDVRIIIDDFGSMKLFTNRYIRKLRSQGLKIVRFNPMRPFLLMFMNNRDHRKIIVVDGHTAFNGGMNISDEYINRKSRFGVWKDTGVCLKGEGAWSFTLMFIEMWDTFCRKHERINDYELYKCQQEVEASKDLLVLPYGDSPLDEEQVGEDVYIDLLNQARHYVYIFTPYLIISERMGYALRMAAKRGVDIRLVTPGIPDKKIIYRLTRSYYRFLLPDGVRIYEYTPGFMHAKSFVSDDQVAVVGTINLDYRSLYLHFECATLFYGGEIIQQIKQDTLETIWISQEITSLSRKSLLGSLTDSLLHLLAPLL